MEIPVSHIAETQWKSSIYQWARQTPTVCGSPICPIFEHEYIYWMNETWMAHPLSHNFSLSCTSFLVPVHLSQSWYLSFVLWDTEKILVSLNTQPEHVVWASSYHRCSYSKHPEESVMNRGTPQGMFLFNAMLGGWSLHSQESRTGQCVDTGPLLLKSSCFWDCEEDPLFLPCSTLKWLSLWLQ